MREYRSREEARQFWAALRRAQRLSERIRRKVEAKKLAPAADEDDQGIAVVPIKETALGAKRQLVRRTTN